MFWQSDPDCPYTVDGLQVVETVWSENIIDLLPPIIEQVNKEMKTLRIVSYSKGFMDDKLSIKDYNIVRFESNLPYELFEQSLVGYKGEVRVKKDVLFETVVDKSLLPPVISRRSSTFGFFAVPTKVQPSHVHARIP